MSEERATPSHTCQIPCVTSVFKSYLDLHIYKYIHIQILHIDIYTHTYIYVYILGIYIDILGSYILPPTGDAELQQRDRFHSRASS